MTDADWQALLDRTPSDASLRLQYSDWLEEQGRPTAEAEVQRWLARARKWPNQTIIDWEWWREGSGAWNAEPPVHRQLPHALFEHLPGTAYSYRTYSSRRGAEQALVLAWQQLLTVGALLP